MKQKVSIFLWGLVLAVFIAGTLISLYTSVHSSGTVTFVNEEPLQDAYITPVAYISGAVNNPGIYEITENLRVSQLIELSGGFNDNVDQEYINTELNLANFVTDGDHIKIPFAQNTDSTEQNSSASTELVSINNASLTELTTLDGVGPSTAEKIIGGRPYSSIEDLLNVSGIGEKTLDNIRNDIML